MSPADLDLARELRARLPETVYELSESWVVEENGRRVVRGRLAGMRYVFSNGFSNGGHEFSARSGEPIWVPDLHDPTGATAGVLLAVLQSSISADVATHTGRGGRIQAVVSWMGQRFDGSTLAVAAARALVALGRPL